MSLRDGGGEEECFEYNFWNEERKPTHERQDSLDSLEEGKFCAFLVFDLSLLMSTGFTVLILLPSCIFF